MKFKTAILDDKRIAYTDETIFKIQFGRDKKSSYKTLRTITGNLFQAVMHFNMLNIRYPSKKRLWCDSFNKPLLIRIFGISYRI
jgi:hypothetical protein